jgi:hypothetical protein
MSAFPEMSMIGMFCVPASVFISLQISDPVFPGILISSKIRSGFFSRIGPIPYPPWPVITLNPFLFRMEDTVKRKSGSSSITAISFHGFTVKWYKKVYQVPVLCAGCKSGYSSIKLKDHLMWREKAGITERF